MDKNDGVEVRRVGAKLLQARDGFGIAAWTLARSYGRTRLLCAFAQLKRCEHRLIGMVAETEARRRIWGEMANAWARTEQAVGQHLDRAVEITGGSSVDVRGMRLQVERLHRDTRDCESRAAHFRAVLRKHDLAYPLAGFDQSAAAANASANAAATPASRASCVRDLAPRGSAGRALSARLSEALFGAAHVEEAAAER